MEVIMLDKTKNKIKFTRLEEAQDYVKALGYSFQSSDNFKAEKQIIYRKRKSNNYIVLRTVYNYLNCTSMDSGFQYTL